MRYLSSISLGTTARVLLAAVPTLVVLALFIFPFIIPSPFGRSEEEQEALVSHVRAMNRYVTSKQWNLALSEINEMIRIDPDYAKAYKWRGNMYRNLGDNLGAIQEYNKAIQSGFDDAEIYVARAFVYQHLGEHELSVEDFDVAIGDYDPPPFDRLPANDQELRDWADERSLYIQDWIYWRGFSHYRLGNTTQAAKDHARTCPINPIYCEPNAARPLGNFPWYSYWDKHQWWR
jgi:tetratricopeptide (TPR) repeat protein